MEFRESFASKYLISICTISQNIKMPLLCYIILTMASQWPTKFQVQGQCFKVKQNNQSRKSQKLFIFRASNPSITSHSQCQSKFPKNDCESFARRTLTTPKIRTFTTPKFGHFPPPKKNFCQEDNCHPHFFFFFWRIFLGFFDLQLMKDIKDGKEEVLEEVVMEHIK